MTSVVSVANMSFKWMNLLSERSERHHFKNWFVTFSVSADSNDSVNVIQDLNRSFANEGRRDVNHVHAVTHLWFASLRTWFLFTNCAESGAVSVSYSLRAEELMHYSPWTHCPSVSEREPQGWLMNWMTDCLAAYQFRELESTVRFGEQIFLMNHFNERILEIQYSTRNCRFHHYWWQEWRKAVVLSGAAVSKLWMGIRMDKGGNGRKIWKY